MLRAYLSLLLKQRELIVQDDMERFEENLEQQEEIVIELRGIEQHRSAQMEDIGREWGEHIETLAELMHRVQGGHRHKLEFLHQDLVRLIEEISRENEKNRLLIERSRELAEQQLQLLRNLGHTTGPYRGVDAFGKVIDHTV